MNAFKVTRVSIRRPNHTVTYSSTFSPAELRYLVQYTAHELVGLSYQAARKLGMTAEGAVQHIDHERPNRFSLGSHYRFELEAVA